MRICLVYDCLFPWTIGGAERWYRNLGERLAAEGHDITYLTMRQWDEPPQIDGIRVLDVAPRMPLYRDGKRRMLPPLRFGLGVGLHLLRHGREYDVVHTASFPYFSLIAAGLLRPFGGYRISCDWAEVWSREYWREYLGPLGFVGELVQSMCARVPQKAYAFSRLHKDRLHRLGLKSVTLLTGLYDPKSRPTQASESAGPPTIVYAGRFIPEKRVKLLVEALAEARAQMPELKAQLIGDGPTRAAVIERIEQLGLSDCVSCPGFVTTEELERAMSSAACLAQPSSREGYGLVVVEAAHRGVPVVTVAAPDNASTELIDEGRNGYVVARPTPEELATAIVQCVRQGPKLRRSTRDWFVENEKRLSIEASLAGVVKDYGSDSAAGPAQALKGVACA